MFARLRDGQSPTAASARRLADAFRHIAAMRMHGMPLLHPRLAVEAIGFQEVREQGGLAASGILLTPWFMNLIWLPLDGQGACAPGSVREHRLGGERFDFIGASEDGFGAYEMCSLFSPMFEFADQAGARATAWEILGQLRKVAQAPSEPAAGRRAFLTGRSPRSATASQAA